MAYRLHEAQNELVNLVGGRVIDGAEGTLSVLSNRTEILKHLASIRAAGFRAELSQSQMRVKDGRQRC